MALEAVIHKLRTGREETGFRGANVIASEGQKENAVHNLAGDCSCCNTPNLLLGRIKVASSRHEVSATEVQNSAC